MILRREIAAYIYRAQRGWHLPEDKVGTIWDWHRQSPARSSRPLIKLLNHVHHGWNLARNNGICSLGSDTVCKETDVSQHLKRPSLVFTHVSRGSWWGCLKWSSSPTSIKLGERLIQSKNQRRNAFPYNNSVKTLMDKYLPHTQSTCHQDYSKFNHI